MKLGCILVNYNNGSGTRLFDFSRGPSEEPAVPNDFLSLCLDSYFNSIWMDNHFIIVDDGSTDNNMEIINSYKDRVSEIIVNGSNIGLAPSMQMAASRLIDAGCDAICRFDADIEFLTAGWDFRFMKHFAEYPTSAAIGGCQILPHGAIWSMGDMIIHPRGYTHIMMDSPGRNVFETSVFLNENLILGNIECDSVMGCLAAFRSSAYQQVGGLRKEFEIVRGQTEDLNLRFLLEGYQCMALGGVAFIHRHSEHAPKTAITDKTANQSLQVWRDVWGWDKIKPDLNAIYEQWKGTRLTRHLVVDKEGAVSYIGP